MKNTTKNIQRALIAITAFGAVILTTSACSSLSESGTMDRSQTYEYTSMHDPEAKEILPTWVADDAENISLLQRTTGDERILTYKSKGELPRNCITIKTEGKPTEAELIKGLAAESKMSHDELQNVAQDQAPAPLLEAGWWPTGAEAKTTHLCGKWWISQEGSKVYGYTPENKIVADGIKRERDKNKDHNNR